MKILKLFSRLFTREDEILRELVLLKSQNVQIMENLERLKAAVEKETSVVQSVVTLLTNLSGQVRSLPVGDQQAIDDLADKIEKQTDILAQAVAANTPTSTDGGSDTPGDGSDAPAPAPDGGATTDGE